MGEDLAMLLAAVRGDVAYDVLLFLHLASLLVAFSPVAAHPLTSARVKRAQGEAGLVELSKAMHANGRAVYFPALIATGVFGILMALVDGDFVELSDGWVMGGLGVWIAICGVVSGMILPAERALAAGDLAAEKRVAVGGQIATLLVVVILWLMIFKPGA
jgi:uncharacterized membrane protein